jgi:uroporphyrinogen decarboxylase
MSTSKSHRKRIEECLSGIKPDKVPIALWRHFPVDDQTSQGLASATIDFQKMYDFDLIKVSPSSSFCIKDWGAIDKWTGHYHGTREYKKFVIDEPEDWRKLPDLDPTIGHLGKQLSCLTILRDEFSPHTPIIQTVFSPLSQAKNLIGEEKLLIHLRKYPDVMHAGLKIITETTLRFVKELEKIGIDGVFFAIQHAQHKLLTTEEFGSFCRKYDLEILDQCQSFWLNVGHIHGNDVMFDEVLDYPVNVLNWHDQETEPSLLEAKAKFDGVVCGGLRQEETMVLGTPELVYEEATRAIQETKGEKFILGTGCVVPITAPQGNYKAAIQSTRLIDQM